MAVDDLARADPLPRVLSWLSDHAAVTGALGGADRVGAFNEAPFPRLRLLDNGGNDRDLQWLIATEIQIEALGDMDGSPGKAALRRILYIALGALMELPEVDTPPGEPVVSRVVSTRGGGWVPEPSGQPRYIAAVHVYSHAPND